MCRIPGLKQTQGFGRSEDWRDSGCNHLWSCLKKVLTFNGRSKNTTVFDVASGKVVRDTTGGKSEFAATDGKEKVYVNIENTNQVVEIDGINTRGVIKAQRESDSGPVVNCLASADNIFNMGRYCLRLGFWVAGVQYYE